MPKTSLTPRRARLVKGLSLAAVFTLLLSLGFSVWQGLTDNYTAVLDTNEIALIQLDPPAAGAPVALMHTTAGDLTFTLYPEECPETVANFISLAQSGAYNGTYVFRVEPDVFFSAGSQAPAGTLTDDTVPSEHIPQELSPKLWPLRGALCALAVKTEGGFWKTLTKTRETYTGSRFLVANSIEFTEEMRKELLTSASEGMKPVAEAFTEHGGIPNYAQQITVFGQLTDGFDVLDAITGAELSGEADAQRPKDDILINSIEIQTAK